MQILFNERTLFVVLVLDLSQFSLYLDKSDTDFAIRSRKLHINMATIKLFLSARFWLNLVELLWYGNYCDVNIFNFQKVREQEIDLYYKIILHNWGVDFIEIKQLFLFISNNKRLTLHMSSLKIIISTYKNNKIV